MEPKMSRIVDISGNDYHMLHVVGLDYCEKKRSYWICRCECGKVVSLRKDYFAYEWSKQKSCGCLHRKVSSERMTEIHRKRRKEQGK